MINKWTNWSNLMRTWRVLMLNCVRREKKRRSYSQQHKRKKKSPLLHLRLNKSRLKLQANHLKFKKLFKKPQSQRKLRNQLRYWRMILSSRSRSRLPRKSLLFLSRPISLRNLSAKSSTSKRKTCKSRSLKRLRKVFWTMIK